MNILPLRLTVPGISGHTAESESRGPVLGHLPPGSMVTPDPAPAAENPGPETEHLPTGRIVTDTPAPAAETPTTAKEGALQPSPAPRVHLFLNLKEKTVSTKSLSPNVVPMEPSPLTPSASILPHAGVP